MSRRRAILVAVVVGLAVVMGLATTAVVTWVHRWSATPGTRGVATVAAVPVSWKDVRTSAGHRAHVERLGLECRACHEPSKGKFEAPRCEGCHPAVEIAVHADVPVAESCRDCHDFRGQPDVRPWGCLRCHAESHGETAAVVLHKEAPCGDCHRPHARPSLVPRACGSCHEAQRVRHGTKGPVADAATCLDCHRMHEPEQVTNRRCASCHLTASPRVPASALAHTSGGCATCHAAHDFSARGARPCTSCHDQQAHGGGVTTSHDRCEGCHAPHDVARPAPCARCHDTSPTGHPAVAGVGVGVGVGVGASACAGCHPIHPPGAQGQVAQVGQAPVPTTVACVSCHPNKTPSHKAGLTCASCHARHDFAAPPRSCVSCHPKEARTVRAGHDRCERCHTDTHDASSPRPTCVSCHAEKLATSPTGHRACATCHETHAGSLRPAASCTSCHATSKLPGLHQVGEHRPCQTCHTAHATQPRSDRATCLSCHRDLAAHEPTAKTCTGCHPFGG